MYISSLRVVALLSLFLLGCSGFDKQKFSESKPEKYIVVFKKDAMSAKGSSSAGAAVMAAAIAENHALPTAEKVFSVALQGGLYVLDEDKALAVAKDPRVAYVEKDQILTIYSTQSNAPWGLDRLDQNDLPLSLTYNFDLSGSVVNAYVIDTGILTTHQEFQGRASSGFDFADKDADATDCNGHGTHVAGTIAGATYGVAKNAKLIAVRVLNCDGTGNLSDVIAGIEWVTANHVKPAVANMSLGGGVSQAIDDALAASIQAGVTYVVAAGNENSPACNVSPARVPAAITVGSTTKTDARSSFSNYGSCVDVFAPGSDITSSWIGSNSATDTISGTSMASPHVAGVAALYLSQHPQATPAEVANAIVGSSVPGKVTSPGSGSPNRLASSLFGTPGGGGGNPGGGNPSPSELQNGAALSSLQGAKDSEAAFTIQIPSGATNLNVLIAGNSGDADLYVRAGDKPTASAYDCRPFLNGSSESCAIAAPKAGIYHILIKGYSAYSGLSLNVDFQKPSGGGGTLSGSLTGKGDFQYQPSPEFTAAAGMQHYALKGPAGADFDLYLYKKSGNSFTEVARAITSSANEDIQYGGSAGTYRLKVISYSGSGRYELLVEKP